MITPADKARLVVGFKQVKKACAEHRATRVYVANDCDSNMLDQLTLMVNSANVDVFYIDTMAELGTMCDIACKASCAAVC